MNQYLTLSLLVKAAHARSYLRWFDTGAQLDVGIAHLGKIDVEMRNICSL